MKTLLAIACMLPFILLGLASFIVAVIIDKGSPKWTFIVSGATIPMFLFGMYLLLN